MPGKKSGRAMSDKDKNKLFDIALKKASKGKKEKDLRAISDKDMKKALKMNRGGEAKMNRGGKAKKKGMARGCGAATKGKSFNK
jgi:hypothetical protein|tara:strand:+ start:404 stop:655 length:252 start_codon:yes stop_codon:yes gene_type:complete